ncbi:hypothetical protein BGZ94_007933 [Podila epigama]|nr:hypothetical protein BGZ94_007933 [Podila epigama]
MRSSAILLLSTVLVLLTASIEQSSAQVSVPGRYSPRYAGSSLPSLHRVADSSFSSSTSIPTLQLSPLDNLDLLRQENLRRQHAQRMNPMHDNDGAYQFGYAVEMTATDFKNHHTSTLSAGRWVSLRDLEGHSHTRNEYDNDNDDDEGETMVWQLEIYSPSALSLNLIFSDFELPPGTEFYVSGKKTILGAFTAQINNKADRIFATAPVAGDRLLLEYYTPRSVLERSPPRLQLSHVVHGYKPMLYAASSDSTASGYRAQDGSIQPRSRRWKKKQRMSQSSLVDQREQQDGTLFDNDMYEHDDDEGSNFPRVMSGKCNVDVACHQREFHDQSRSVGVILTDYNQKYCTGALINNARQDGRQLFLTANHCSGFTDTSAHIVMFNHEKLQCGGPREVINEHDTAQGLFKLGNYGPSDYTLYEIVEPIPDSYDLFLAGWSAEPIAPSSRLRDPEERERMGERLKHDDPIPQPPPPPDHSNDIPIVGIHHPSGDSKKISFFYNGSLPETCWSECQSNENYHWQIPRWDEGTTEPGSSGSPLFDADKRIVGQLHGGSASCWNKNGYDVYGGLHASFKTSPKAKDRLATYLDPEKTGITVLDGYSLEAARRETREREGGAGKGDHRYRQGGSMFERV